LLDAHRYCDNRQALGVAVKMSDYFAVRMARPAPDRIEAMFRTGYTANPHNEFAGMGEVLADLYLREQCKASIVFAPAGAGESVGGSCGRLSLREEFVAPDHAFRC
jgi:hypothetical protein